MKMFHKIEILYQSNHFLNHAKVFPRKYFTQANIKQITVYSLIMLPQQHLTVTQKALLDSYRHGVLEQQRRELEQRIEMAIKESEDKVWRSSTRT